MCTLILFGGITSPARCDLIIEMGGYNSEGCIIIEVCQNDIFWSPFPNITEADELRLTTSCLRYEIQSRLFICFGIILLLTHLP